MGNEIATSAGGHRSPFERIRKVNETGNEYWESRDLAEVLEYTQYRNFEAVIEKAKLACFNSVHRIEDHFADVSKMIEIGKGGRNWRTKASRRSGGFCCVKRCAAITSSWPTPEELPVTESIKKIETQQCKQLGKAKTPAKKKGLPKDLWVKIEDSPWARLFRSLPIVC